MGVDFDHLFGIWEILLVAWHTSGLLVRVILAKGATLVFNFSKRFRAGVEFRFSGPTVGPWAPHPASFFEASWGLPEKPGTGRAVQPEALRSASASCAFARNLSERLKLVALADLRGNSKTWIERDRGSPHRSQRLFCFRAALSQGAGAGAQVFRS